MTDQVVLPAKWVNCSDFDAALNLNPLLSSSSSVTLKFPVDCKIMIDAASRILSFANQLNFIGKRVQLHFDEGKDGAMGYLDRMGFFDRLHPGIKATDYPQLRPEMLGY